MSFKLSLEEIENGYIITRASGKIYAEKPDLAIRQAQVALDEIKRELLNPQPKT